MDKLKEEKGYKSDTDMTTEDLKYLVSEFKKAIKQQTGKDFPTDPWEQLWEAILAVFRSWNNDRAITYRELNGIPHDWGTPFSPNGCVR